MHAHHKNLLRDFWLISPGKTPTGKTSQRGEILINFFSNVQDRKIVENTTYLHRQTSSQSLENVFSKPAYTLLLFLCKIKCKCTAPTGRTSPSKTVPNKCCLYLEKRAGI